MSHTMGLVDCYCGRRAVLRTSWTDDNPGRRFHACLQYSGGGCSFFDWEDPPMCRRSRVIIPGLLRKINALKEDVNALKEDVNALEEEVGGLRRTNRRLVKLVVYLPVIFAVACWIWSALFAVEKPNGVPRNAYMLA
ncbi:hypothetical protein DH2020_006113 [Rehmannia glutinosa]|uniref:GRF-type domain-containing protein n=1 Tax=Rehmannia glutinosa TaxID=99300 RepID=A0ABR0XI67_REHGL